MMEAIDLLFGDYIDALLAVLTLILGVALVALPAVLAHRVLRRINARPRLYVSLGLVASTLCLSSFYYAGIPRGYVQALAWRHVTARRTA
jgi:ABC-type Mn2+/Zn2+ transport system permease subunit